MRSIVRAFAGDSTITSVLAMDTETVFLPAFAQFSGIARAGTGRRCATISERDTSTFCQIARIGPLRLGRPDPPVRARTDASTGPPSRVLHAPRWWRHPSGPQAAGTPEPGRLQELRQMTAPHLRPESGQNRTQAPQQSRPQSPLSLLRRAAGRDLPDSGRSGYCPARPGRRVPAPERIARL